MIKKMTAPIVKGTGEPQNENPQGVKADSLNPVTKPAAEKRNEHTGNMDEVCL